MGDVRMFGPALLLVFASLAGCGGDEAAACPDDTPASCGNGYIDSPNEQCDQGDEANGVPAAWPAGMTCSTLVGPNTTGLLQCECCTLTTGMCVQGTPGAGGPTGGNGF